MKKYFILPFILFSLQSAVVDGAAVKVGDKIITLYEIYQIRETNKVSTEEAVEILIKKKLEESEAEKLGIAVDDLEVTQAIDEIVLKNNTTLLSFKTALESRGLLWDTYKINLKNQMLHERLYKKISAQSLSMIDEEQLKTYYNEHISEFSLPETLIVYQYASKNRSLLEKFIASPLTKNDNIKKEEVKLESKTADPKIFGMLGSLTESSFSPIFSANGEYATFFIKEKKNLTPRPFNDIKNMVYTRIIASKEERVIKEYFERLKASAYIKVLRLPN